MNKKQRLGLCIKTLRKERGLTQEQLAELVERSVDAVSKMERGVTFPQLETLILVSDALKTPLSDLVLQMEGNKNSKRIELEMSLISTIRKMDIKKLAIAVQQVKVLVDENP